MMQFAVTELQGLSDSGIYTTLSLHAVLSAEAARGVFHDKWHFKLALASPHFRDGAPTSTHDVVVMRALDDAVMSFAIDEFPDMDEDAIQAHWEQMVDRHRAQRGTAFRQFEREEFERDAQKEEGGGATLDDLLAELREQSDVELQRCAAAGTEAATGTAGAATGAVGAGAGAGQRSCSGVRSHLASDILDERWLDAAVREQEAFDLHLAMLGDNGGSAVRGLGNSHVADEL